MIAKRLMSLGEEAIVTSNRGSLGTGVLALRIPAQLKFPVTFHGHPGDAGVAPAVEGPRAEKLRLVLCDAAQSVE